jgi:hypothetical protein
MRHQSQPARSSPIWPKDIGGGSVTVRSVDTLATACAAADKVDLTLTAAAYEREWAQAAWASVAPEDNMLPADASPMQRMLHARMETSEFVYQLVTRRLVRS